MLLELVDDPARALDAMRAGDADEAIYRSELVTITNEQIVLHTKAGLISIPLSDVPIVTHRADESHISQGSRVL